jgi:hypothetical protein
MPDTSQNAGRQEHARRRPHRPGIAVVALPLAWLLAAAMPGLAAEMPAAPSPKPDLTVMTRNLYVGGDILAVGQAQTPDEFIEAAKAFLQAVAATDFPARAEALAAEIADKRPDAVGLQEVYDFQLNGVNVGTPFVNYLDLLLAAIARHGETYVAIAKVKNADLNVPLDLNGDGAPELVRVTDRDVILVRHGLAASVLPLGTLNPTCRVSEQGCNYLVVAGVTVPGLGSIAFERGYVAAVVVKGTESYLVFNTHLEVRTPAPANPYSAIVQAAQATELKAVVDAVPAIGRVVITGDFNSSPEDGLLPVPPPLQVPPYNLPPVINPPYRQWSEGEDIVGLPSGAAYFDAWTLRPGRPPGFTCCQDADLSNEWSVLDERIDLVFSREQPAGVKANVVGNDPADRFSGLWPSDHAGVFVRYAF